MNGNYRERPTEPMRWDDDGQQPKPLKDEEGLTWLCLPLDCEAQMWEVFSCRRCGRESHWVGIGSPFGDGQQCFLQSQAWCYWCFPRENFSEEELLTVHLAEWARQQTKDEIVDFVRFGAKWSFEETVKPSEVVDDIRWLI